MEQRLTAIRLPYAPLYKSSLKDQQRSSAFSDYRLTALFCMIMIIFAVFLHLTLANYIKTMDQEIYILQKESVQLKNEYKILLEEQDKLKSKDRLENIGKALGLHPPTKSQILNI
jgi:cell division protein FtsL